MKRRSTFERPRPNGAAIAATVVLLVSVSIIAAFVAYAYARAVFG